MAINFACTHVQGGRFLDLAGAVLHHALDVAGVGPFDVVDGQLARQLVDDDPAK